LDVNRILLDILVVLLAAKVAAELADRVNVPAVVGEIAAGIIIGPSVLGWVHTSQSLQTLAQLGVILLLLEVGLEMDLAELGSVGKAAILVAFAGVAVPMATGAGAGLALGMSGKEAVFVGAALTATSVGITARVFGDLRALATVEAKTVLGAAVADDILGLVILTVVTRVVTEGSVSLFGILWIVVIAVGFVVLTTLIGVRIVPQAFAFVRRYSRSPGTLVAIALAFTLAISELAHAAQLAPIVGAFVAGICLARSSAAGRVRSELAPVTHLLVPVFFLQIGIDADVGQFAKPAVLGMAGILFVIAVIGKLCSVVGLIGSPGDRLLVGIGMIPRGEVGLIFATLGLNQHVFGQDVYAALLLVVLLTTVGTPPAIRWRLLKLREGRRATSTAAASGGIALVHIGDTGLVELEDEPLPSDALVVALYAARLCAQRAASPALLEWLEEFPAGPRRWDDKTRAEFFSLLREAEPRSWRMLTASGVLQRCLPELDDALVRRRPAALELDPLATLRLLRLSRVHELLDLERTPPPYTNAVLLAALALDAADDDSDQAVVIARRTVQRLDLGARVEQTVAGLVNDVDLMRAAARRNDALSEESVLQIAVHLDNVDQADALYLLSRAGDAHGRHDSGQLGALHELVRAALAMPELVGREAGNEVEARRAEASRYVTDMSVRERIRTAPRAYVLAQAPVDLARQAGLCEPALGRHEVRVEVEEEDGYVRVEVGARDRVGLLARTTQVLFEAHCTIEEAAATTWADGSAVASYRVRTNDPPNPRELRERLGAMLREPFVSAPVPDIELVYDDASSPWHTRCTVLSPDRPGLLYELTSAFASAGLSVHSARVTTDGQQAVDQFELTDARGAKLDDRAKERVLDVTRKGAVTKRRRFPRDRYMTKVAAAPIVGNAAWTG
jgi:Kef-type K+ transport system membrane component KefB/predicted amino acid-binding ACT domain protein